MLVFVLGVYLLGLFFRSADEDDFFKMFCEDDA